MRILAQQCIRWDARQSEPSWVIGISQWEMIAGQLYVNSHTKSNPINHGITKFIKRGFGRLSIKYLDRWGLSKVSNFTVTILVFIEGVHSSVSPGV